MSRIFVPITLDDLKSKISACCGDDGDIDYRNLTPTVAKDLDKVKFDCENISYEQNDCTGYHLLSNGLATFSFLAGGDWETSVWSCIYWDGKKLRGYTPENGNLWNTDTKEAYGNNDDADLKNARKRWPDNKYLNECDADLDGWFDNYDIEIMQQDIMDRIVPKSAKLQPKIPSKDLADFTDDELLKELKIRANLTKRK